MVHLDFNIGFHNQIARGLRRFRATRPHWVFLGCDFSQPLSVPFKIDGILGHFHNPAEQLQYLQNENIRHIVSITNLSPGPFPWTQVINDDVEIGRMAARYFLRKRFQHFAVWTLGAPQFSKDRVQGFLEVLHENDVRDILILDQQDRENLKILKDHFPLAAFVVSDNTANSLLSYLSQAQIRVPGDTAILGVDNDEQVELYTPIPLSSIQTAGEQIGFRACEELEKMMSQGPSPPKVFRIPPVGLHERISTNVIAQEDPLIRKVQAYLDEHLDTLNDIEELARALYIHRRHLDRKFIAATGMSPADWLAHRRIERAETLLLETDYTIDIIAERVGLVNRRRLNLTFKRFSRTLPSTLRKMR